MAVQTVRQMQETIENGMEDSEGRCEGNRGSKDKSLESLSRMFLRVLIKGQPLGLEEAGQLLGGQGEQGGKTKVRRLYDIVNVFKCLGFIKKVKACKNLGGKPVYQWQGCERLEEVIREKGRNIFSEEDNVDCKESKL